jgi:hypothetical protein
MIGPIYVYNAFFPSSSQHSSASYFFYKKKLSAPLAMCSLPANLHAYVQILFQLKDYSLALNLYFIALDLWKYWG